MDTSPSSWLPGGEFFTDSPENSSEWPWTDGPTDTGWRHHQSADPVGYEGYLASAIYLTLTGLIALPGNVIAITVFLTEKEFRKKQQNSFVLNLAIADFSVCVFAYPSSTIAGFAGGWVLGDVGCTIYGFLCFTFSLTSMVTLCAISVYRYIVICKPQYAHLLTHRRTNFVIIGIWLYALVFTVPPLVGVNRYTYEPMHITCSLDWNVQYPGETAYLAAVLVIVFVLQVLIMCFCYFNIIVKSANLKFAALANERTKKAAKKDTWKTSMMCLTMVVSFLIAWTPYAVSSTWDILSEEDLPIIATILPSMFAKSSCMMNPIIYSCCSNKFRQAAAKSFRRLGCMRKQSVPPSPAELRNTVLEFTAEPACQAIPMSALPSSSAKCTSLLLARESPRRVPATNRLCRYRFIPYIQLPAAPVMDTSPSSWLPGGEFFTDSPENSSEWPWTDGPTDTGWRHHQSADPVGYEGYLASAIYLTLTGLIALPGNVIVITVFLTEKEFRKKQQNSFVLNLAIADFSVCVFAYPLSAIAGFAGGWVLGDVGCTIYGFLCFTFSLVSMVTLCAISVYRYIVICKPQYAHLLTHRRTNYVIIGIWLFSLVFTVPPLVGLNRYTYDPMGIICSLDWNVQHPTEAAYVLAVLVILYILQVLIMCFCYVNIIVKSANLKFAALANEETKKAAKKDTFKTSLMCLTMVVSFLIAWTPYAVSSTWDILSEEDLPIIATILPTMFAKSSCMMNPVIYACCSNKFRQAAARSFRRLGCMRM
ncbi:uncharacterized protein LOC144906607 [Branchiostoma floridae x Branchiostoma belcheri]